MPRLCHLTGVTHVQFTLSHDKPLKAYDDNNRIQDDDEQAAPFMTPKESINNGPNGDSQMLSGGLETDQANQNGNSLDSASKPEPSAPQKPSITMLSRKREMLKCVPFQVRTTGLVHSTQMLRIFVGHPLFFTHIYPRFNVTTPIDSGSGGDGVSRPAHDNAATPN